MARRENKLVIKFGQVTPSFAKLVQECRSYFEPGVAKNLKEEKKWKIKDYVQLAKHFTASHLWVFSQSEEHNNLKVISLLEETGRTFYFKVTKYQVGLEMLQKAFGIGTRMNGYFIVPINIDKTDPINGMIDEIKNNSKVSHLTSRVIVIKKLYDNNYLFSNYMIKKEEKPGAANQVKVSLVEIGPVMTVELQKIEKGICSGDVVYHRYIHKTPEELKERERTIRRRAEEKLQRKAQQEENVRRKKEMNARKPLVPEDQDSSETELDTSEDESEE
ncbi:hypothetical protein NEAUS04_1962 [Nematocida ausubeli]|uniref:Brix domain-containing protein n=1 Tax=Nematocida ausubeli (strain ATCC PRA-371 / ERTm2) TaxID=1913371 RepID=H8ZAT0_NEMA1|nr:uncharacterized protein NESG_01469 [Nematocida ausubeli]EHY65983.1 hypothetical protein NERG_00679 [Nematocida ausubeli]KAI5134076.1 hypothetical protein NEAUS06_0910 [Nematocida ausubeli]KAI5137256.1 hypothetical protein NEAUS07_1907 [Nematocida ausubeli]KAI5150279.1 hypothetical protein NEAUS05_2110 [Nematocida ausubeli]KAI5164124.1 hypothetical protein NEAUS04_1962 [Nematocida ausubeli]